MTTMLVINATVSCTFVMLKHPLSMGLSLLMQTIAISMITGMMNINFWFSYIMFLILIGGMMILFMYMTSIASNEKFKTSIKLLTISIIMIVMLKLLINNSTQEQNINNLMIKSNLNMSMEMSFNKLINFPLNMVLMLVIIYLLITLIATVKISNPSQGPLRQMN